MPSIPEGQLDRLTEVSMPAVPAAALPTAEVNVDGLAIPVISTGVLVVGSGAAGLRAAVELQRRGERVLVMSMSLFGGTSACSGSDKQTLHTCGTSRRGDDFTALAAALGAGGCMDADTAYAEAVGSVHTLAGLQYLGLPLPTDRFGAVLRYQTDHDDVGRATSCGPRTSRLMVKVLAEEAVRLGIPFLRACEAVRLLTDQGRVAGVVALDRERPANHGLIAVRAHSVVLATGGPGELYRDSVYPAHCYGSLGMAIEAGIAVCNLTESQFGIGTRRQEFPWNLSGTYVQVMPYVFSRDAAGTEHNFLAGWYRSTAELAANVFRKGYQWPFHATRMLDFGSSLVDLAISEESRQGRTVLLDFRRNPLPGADGRAFAIKELPTDARDYLVNNGATQALPIDRLRCMNPLAIALYRMHGHDLATTPLPFNVNHQHLNGGVAVDLWNESSLPGCFAVGEVAGTHGVTRPGGAALNAGQVGGLRAAEHIAARSQTAPPADLAGDLRRQVGESMTLIQAALDNDQGLEVPAVRQDIQARMSDHAGFLCPVAQVEPARAAAVTLRHAVFSKGFAIRRAATVADLFRWRHLALASEAVLTALAHYIAQGGGSRGARALLADDGTCLPHDRGGAVPAFRFRAERPEHREHKLVLTWNGTDFAITTAALRTHEDLGRIFFEKNWPSYLSGALHAPGFSHA